MTGRLHSILSQVHSGVWVMSKATIAAVVGLGAMVLALTVPATAHAQQRQGGRPFGAPPGDPSGPTPGTAPAVGPTGSPGGSTGRTRSITVGEAEAQLRDAERQPGNPVRNQTRPLITLGWAYWRAGREREAVATLQRLLGMHDGLPQPNRPVLGRILSDLGYFLSQVGRISEAAQMLERALPIVESEPSLNSDSYVAGMTYGSLGTIRILQGRVRDSRV